MIIRSIKALITVLLVINLEMIIFGGNFFEEKIKQHITDKKCQEAVINCTNHWDMIPFIPPVGLCEEYFSIECMTELVVSSKCIDEPGYGEFLTQIAIVIEDCAKSGMRWTAVFLRRLINRSIKHILCHKIQNQCYNITGWNPKKGICDLNFPACIMRTYGEEYCQEFEDDLEAFDLKLMANDIASDTMDDNKDNEGNPATMQGTILAGQKRARDERGGPATKKAHVSDTEDNMVQVKVLIPSAAVGALIGKGGETMRNLKSESGCRLQMSKNQEVYPGTNERICLVKGKIASVLKVSDVILEKIREKVDNNTPSDIFDHKGMERKNEMKLVVPNTSAGMVIGKSGARIKEIREQTGANIQVYPKAGSQEAKVSQERIITIAAEQDEILMDALQRVLEKVAADPQHAMATAPDHKDDSFGPASGLLHGIGGGVQGQTIQPFDFSSRSQNAPQFGGAPTVQQNHFGQISHAAAQVWQPNQQRALEATYAAPAKDLYQQNNMAGFKFNPMQGLGNNELLAFLDSLQSTLRTSGFNETSVAEVMQAMQILAKYNIMGLGLGLGVAAMAQMRTNETPSLTSSQSLSQPQRFETTNLSGTTATVDNTDRRFTGGTGGGSGTAGGTAGAAAGGGQNDINKSLSGVGGVLIDVLSQNKQNSSSSSAQNFAASVIKEKIIDNNHIDLEIPDTIVGAILGPRAKTLAEIQHLSGCKVEVHKRGTAAGQGNRLVSLTGDVDCIRNGRMMIDKVINDEQMRRNQQAQSNARGGFR